MEYTKNSEVIVKIEDIGTGGEGIGKVDGYTLFVKDAIIGDEVEAKITKAKKNYAYARVEKILTPSPFRVEPKCSLHRQCGGCQIQALAYEKQLEYKQNKVKNNLVRLGKFEEDFIDSIMEPIIGMEDPYHYRNKGQFPFGENKAGNTITGFYAGRTHSIISNTDCVIGAEENKEILEIIIEFLDDMQIPTYNEEKGTGNVRHVIIRTGFQTKEIMVAIVINEETLPNSGLLVKKLTKVKGMTSICLNHNREKTNVIMGRDLTYLWGQEYITDYIGEIEFRISPLSFYQVNPIQTEKLYGLALDYANLTGSETVWDLYCGIGTISLFLSQKAKNVYGVEVIPEAIEDAKENAKINQITNVEFYVGKVEEVLPNKLKEDGIKADVIVVDPPRKGCDEVCLETMVKMQPKTIVYISCDSATLARDLQYLCEKGYELEKVRAVDQFCHTLHVETVIQMTLAK